MKIKKIHIFSQAILFSVFVFFVICLSPNITNAADSFDSTAGGCDYIGQCVKNRPCVVVPDDNGGMILTPSIDKSCGSSSIGSVQPPDSILAKNLYAGQTTSSTGIGIIIFLSNLVRVFAIVTGIWAMFNFIKAGYTLITSMSDAGAMEKVRNSLTMTVVGLTIVASAYIIAAVAGALLFGDPGFILNPTLQGAVE